MANVWMHNGFLQVEGQKMSKSLGNFVTIRELLTSRVFGSNMWHGRVLRLAMLMTHYRQPIDWTVERLVEVRATLKDWIDSVVGLDANTAPPQELVDALSDDMNTPEMISFLHSLHKAARPRTKREVSQKLAASMKFLGIWDGETSLEVYGYGYGVIHGPSSIDVKPLIDARLAARRAKNWAESDRIRNELAAMGVAIKDNKDGTTTWEVKR
jgi:cysteinyl-tRNA synthetase